MDELIRKIKIGPMAEREKHIGELLKNSLPLNEKNKIFNELFESSQWPICNFIAEALAKLGTEEAKEILIKGLTHKRHHNRSSALKAFATIDPDAAIEKAKLMLSDSSYEVRTDAQEVLDKLS